jgi:hypothetical protein
VRASFISTPEKAAPPLQLPQNQREQQQQQQQLAHDAQQQSSTSSSSSASVNAAPYADSTPHGTPLAAQQQLSSSSSSTVKGTMQATGGNAVTAKVAYALSDIAFIYPITPATPMGEAVEAWAADGRRNLHGNVMQVRKCNPCCSFFLI